jgi:outer membrane protein assembly factor BamB
MMGYSTISAPAIADDGSIYSTCRNGKLYKWSTTGSSVWEKEIWKESTAVSGYGTPVIDTDGTIFISGGDGGTGNGVLKAFAANGTEKWKFTEWYRADGSTPAPSCTATLPSLGTTNLYFGHTGQNGIVASINKATGKRNGFAAPAGGARQGIALTSTGKIAWMGGTSVCSVCLLPPLIIPVILLCQPLGVSLVMALRNLPRTPWVVWRLPKLMASIIFVVSLLMREEPRFMR